jgi:hypothetical protein
VDDAVQNIKADITINILEQIIADMVNNVTGEENSAYIDGVQDCIEIVDSWEKEIREDSTNK